MTDEELLGYLRRSSVGYTHPLRLAADRIEALVRELATSNEIGRAFEEDAGQQRDRAERLEAAADYILDGMGIHAPDYEIDPDDDLLDAANSNWVRDVLTRLAAALKGANHE